MEKAHNHNSHNHDHSSMTNVDGSNFDMPEKMFSDFTSSLTDAQIAIVNVKGMVCDFCARGIEKTFYQDDTVKKVLVSLEKGKVLIAYSSNKKIDKNEIKNIFLDNGQTATDITIRKI